MAVSITPPMTKDALVAQLDRALPSEGRGHRFESCRVHHFSYIIQYIKKYLLLRCSKVLTLLQSVVKFYIESKIAQAQNLTEKIVIQTKKHRSVPIRETGVKFKFL